MSCSSQSEETEGRCSFAGTVVAGRDEGAGASEALSLGTQWIIKLLLLRICGLRKHSSFSEQVGVGKQGFWE